MAEGSSIPSEPPPDEPESSGVERTSLAEAEPTVVANGRQTRRWRQMLALPGLALCVGCLWALLSGGPLPGWRPAGPEPAANGSVVVIIDPGHGGGDSGAVAQGVVEKTLNLDVGLRVAALLRARGVTVRLTREDDHFVPLEDRVRLANATPNAVFVSIHFNDASGNGKAVSRASGIETYYCERKLAPDPGWTWASLFGTHGAATAGPPDQAIREGQSLADCIQGSLIAGTAATDRGIKERSLYVTHRVRGPAVLVEGGFVSNPSEAHHLGETGYRQTIAESIAQGIIKYLEAARSRQPLVAQAAFGT